MKILEKVVKFVYKIGEYLQLTTVINLKMYYFVARHCVQFILYSIRFLLICQLPHLMACILIKLIQNSLHLKRKGHFDAMYMWFPEYIIDIHELKKTF